MIRFLSISAIAFELCGGLLRAESAPTAGFDPLIDRAEHRMEQFWDQFSAVTCTETMEQSKLADDGRVLFKKRSSYDYLVLLLLSGGDLSVQESRLAQGKTEKEFDRALLSTSGFSTMILIFHPHFRESFTFSDQGIDPESAALRRVHFEHIHGKRSPSVLQLRSREYPIEWQGTAWIDAATGNIARIQSSLKTSLADIGLQRLESDVRYAPVVLAGKSDPAWMPITASIQADTIHQHWRNQHGFTRYKQFEVSTDSKIEAPEAAPKQ